MKKIICFKLMALFLIATVSASMMIPAADKAKENAKAPEKSNAIDENWQLERMDFIHYAKPTDKPGKPPKPSTKTCYELMGFKWKELPVHYVINPENPDSLSEEFITSAITTSAENWDAVTSVELLNSNIDYSAEFGVQDYKNSIVFSAYPEENAIAVTSIWYTRTGCVMITKPKLTDGGFCILA